MQYLRRSIALAITARLRRYLVALLATVLPIPASADDDRSAEKGSWSLQWENDSFFFPNATDRWYTNGLRLMYSRPWLKEETGNLEKDANDGFHQSYARKLAFWLCRIAD